jgi:hypothetical protein
MTYNAKIDGVIRISFSFSEDKWKELKKIYDEILKKEKEEELLRAEEHKKLEMERVDQKKLAEQLAGRRRDEGRKKYESWLKTLTESLYNKGYTNVKVDETTRRVVCSKPEDGVVVK